MDRNKEKIRTFLSRFIRDRELRDDDEIFTLGFVNSLFAMQLVMFVEQEFQLTITDEDLDLSNFSSIEAIARMIERKTAPPSQV
jgi:methoxymalonate biosynthesis acyl carrier protein